MEYKNMMHHVRKLAKNIDQYVGKDIRDKVLADSETLTAKTCKIKRAEMMKEVMLRMDKLIDKETAIKIRENCACKPPKFLKTSKEIYEKYPVLEDFLRELEKTGLAGRLNINDNIIFCNFNIGNCVCGMVKSTKESIPILWCECCKAHVRWLFEETLQKPLQVEMLSSIVSGSDDCRYKIYLVDE